MRREAGAKPGRPGRKRRRGSRAALLLACALPALADCGRQRQAAAPDRGLAPVTAPGIRDEMSRVAAWQLAHPAEEPRNWTNAVFHIGVLAAYRATGDPDYLSAAARMAGKERWRPGPRARHADDHAIAQTYLELARIRRDPELYRPFQQVVEKMMAETPRPSKPYRPIDFWWADALFMSPPAIAKLARETGDDRYLDFVDRLWLESHELLYDPAEDLFYRDLRFRAETGEKKVFWSRANGWVLAGTARLLEELPPTRPSRGFYAAVFQAMARRVADLQPQDGLWRSDLVAPPDSAPGETSGTALFCYALAWGVNRDVLDREEFLPVIRHSWAALHRNVDPDGRVGWVQPPATAPGTVARRDTAPYGAGAYLLAASEVLKLAADSSVSPPPGGSSNGRED